MGVDLSKQNIWIADGSEVGENLFRLTDFDGISNLGAPSTANNYERMIGYYNGNASLHVFQNGIDTITLSKSGNIGIAFIRLASDINLDTSSYYTISCWAKTSKLNAHLDIGLSYYNTSDSPTWRGGTGSQNFNTINTWQYFIRTFKPDSNTKAICYCFTVIGTNGGADTFSLKQCKLEKGSTPTPWLPNPADNTYISSTVPFTENNKDNNKLYIGNSWISANQFYQI